MPDYANLTVRQMIEGMTLGYNPNVAPQLKATIQFQVTGREPGDYYLDLAEGDCLFHPGKTKSPSLTIITPAEVWLQISRGLITGPEALSQGLYQVQGDLNLLVRLNELFPDRQDPAYQAPPTQRPAGPWPLAGMTWMTLAFLPWMFFWFTFGWADLRLASMIPLALSALIVVYRMKFDRPTWLEVGSLIFFSLAGLLSLAQNPGFARWGSSFSSVFMSILWLTTLLFADLPLCGQYSKWDYTPKLWRTTLFIHPNAVISLVWAGQFLAAGLLAMIAELHHDLFGPLTILRFGLLVPAFIFTVRYQRGAPTRRIEHMDQAINRLRVWAALGLLTASGLLVAITIRF